MADTVLLTLLGGLAKGDKTQRVTIAQQIFSELISKADNWKKLGKNNISETLSNVEYNIDEEEYTTLSCALLCGAAAAELGGSQINHYRIKMNSLITLLLSNNEATSKSAAKAICDLVGKNELAREALLTTTGFAELGSKQLFEGTKRSGISQSQRRLSRADQRAGLQNLHYHHITSWNP
ncbi:MAG: hypothetical protein EZS28_023804 [Streblomastix strix]|uniref:Uncharacterized protein n=1 Tax=Streblomastix strix TaxID=222440 RepID=A0A5J4VDY4_9EUKA|nr:MAG: hypothetical protein EZS28_023804 [Streblomastix strix]